MSAKATVRKLIRPVIGDGAWAYAHDVKVGVREARDRRAVRMAAARRAGLDAELTAREAERKAREWEKKSRDLTALAKHFKTDKWGNHYYTPHYQLHLEHLRDKPMRLLEIGIGGYKREGAGGASLRMWKHFFPKGQIVGLDIEDKSFAEEDRIKVYQGDQTDAELLNRINDESGPFDVIVDDGSHRPEHIRASFATLFPLLDQNGVYVIEDVQTSYWPEWGGSEDLNDPETTMSLGKQLTDSLNYEEFVDESYQPSYYDLNIVAMHFYHNMIFIQKGTNAEGTRRRHILRKRYAADPATT